MGMTGEEKKENLITPEQKYEWASGISDICNRSSGKTGDLISQVEDAKQTLADMQEQYDDILNKDFSYNAAYDPLFQQYAAEYMQRGQLAMKNAMAESSMLTGGYGNSWMPTAGAQAWDSVMSGLNGLIPELRAAAYDEWSADKASTLADLEGDLAVQREMVDAIYGEIDGIEADNEEELINYIAQGVIDDIITEDDIDDYLPAYNDTFTDEEIAALTDEVLRVVGDYNIARNGVVADIIESIIKNPDLNNEEYLTAELGRHGYSYDDYMKAKFNSLKSGGNNDGGKSPTGTMMDEAAELYYQYGMDGLDKWASKYPDYSIDKAIDHVLMIYPDIWETTWEENEDGPANLIGTSEKLLKDRTWTVTDNGGANWGGPKTIDNNARVKDQYGNEYRLDKLAEAMVKDGSFESVEKAKEWLVSQKFGVKGGKLAKEEE